MKKFVQNHLGLSLVEVILGMAIAGAGAMAFMQMFVNQKKAQTSIAVNYEIIAAAQEMRSVLANPNQCQQTFSGENPNGGSSDKLMKLISGSWTQVMKKNESMPGGIMVKSYELDNTIPGLVANETYLKVTFSQGNNSLGDEKVKMLKMSYVPDGSGNISSCQVMSGSEDVWKISTSNPSDIYFNTGNVGIGTDNPQFGLDVAGTSRVSGDSSFSSNLVVMGNLGVGEVAPTNRLEVIGQASVSGNLGIGTTTPAAALDVVGEVKVGSSGAGCSAANQGAIRYNSGSNRIQQCNGSSWGAFLSGPINCAAGKYIQNISAAGVPTCIDDVSGGGGGGLTGPITCPSGKYIEAIAADGTPTCVDDQTGGGGGGGGLSGPITCAPGQVIENIAADGTPKCVNAPAPIVKVSINDDIFGTTYKCGSFYKSKYLNCPSGTTVAISCGLKRQTSAKDEEVAECRPEPTNRRCAFSMDVSSKCTEFTGYCICM